MIAAGCNTVTVFEIVPLTVPTPYSSSILAIEYVVVVDGLTVIVPVNVVIVVDDVPKSNDLVVPSFKVIVVDPVPVKLT